MALSYDGREGSWREFLDGNVTCKFGAGGLLSPASDLARFGSALRAGRIVPAPRVQALLEPAKTTAGEAGNFTFGWGIAKTDSGAPFVMMSGGNVGGRAAIALDPARRAAAGIAGNVEGPRVTTEAKRLLELFAGSVQKS